MKSTVIFSLFPCMSWFFSPGVIFKIFIFVFQKLNSDEHRCDFLCIYPDWSSMIFLDLLIYFWSILEKVGQIFFYPIPSLSFQGFNYMNIRVLDIDSDVTEVLLAFFPPVFFSLYASVCMIFIDLPSSSLVFFFCCV